MAEIFAQRRKYIDRYGSQAQAAAHGERVLSKPFNVFVLRP
jgi:hypothetical protein